jgi:hypothetical protein
LNFTDVTPLNVVPEIVTTVPAGPCVGASGLEIVGSTLNGVALVATPPGVVTFTSPVVAVAGTCVVIDDPSFDSIAADTPLNVSNVAPSNVVPSTVTAAPAGAPTAGSNPVIFGKTLNGIVLVPVPSGVTT